MDFVRPRSTWFVRSSRSFAALRFVVARIAPHKGRGFYARKVWVSSGAAATSMVVSHLALAAVAGEERAAEGE